MLEVKETYKEQIWKELLTMPKGEVVPLTPFALKVKCSLAHLSTTLRVAKDAGFLHFHENGDYVIEEIPESFAVFDNATREKSREYRARVKGTGTPRGPGGYKGAPGFARLPANAQIKISEENILTVLGNILREHKELISKNNKLEEMNKKLKRLILKLKNTQEEKNPWR